MGGHWGLGAEHFQWESLIELRRQVGGDKVEKGNLFKTRSFAEKGRQ